MAKGRVTVTIVYEFEINPAYYPRGSTPHEMVEIDARQLEDVNVLSETLLMSEGVSINAVGEVLEV
jgi:hypothetical protein